MNLAAAVDGHDYALRTVAVAERACQLHLVGQAVGNDEILQSGDDVAGTFQMTGASDTDGNGHNRLPPYVIVKAIKRFENVLTIITKREEFVHINIEKAVELLSPDAFLGLFYPFSPFKNVGKGHIEKKVFCCPLRG